MRLREILLLTLLLVPGAVQAQKAKPAAPIPLDTRAGDHQTYGRMVFAGAKGGHAVDLTAEVNGTTLTVHFQAPVAPSLEPIRRALARYVDSMTLSPDGMTLVAELKRPVTVQHTKLDANTEVVDLVDKPADKTPPPAPAPAKPAAPTEAAVPVPAKPAAAPSADPAVHPVQVPAAPAPTAAKPVGPPPISALSTQAEEKPATPPPTMMVGKSSDSVLQIHYAQIDNGVSIRFQWSNPAAAAIFRRGRAVWLVFDRAQRLDFTGVKLPNAGFLRGIAQVPSRSGTVIRVKTLGDTMPSVRRAGNDWVVDLVTAAAPPTAAITPSVQMDGANASMIFPALDPGTPIGVVDPDAGDTLVVVPLPELGQAVADEIDYPDFQTLPSAQGLVFRPFSDQIAIRSEANDVQVSAPGGLTMSPPDDRDLLPRPPKLSGTLLQPGDWVGPSKLNFTNRELTLLDAIANAPESERTAARLNLAEFYFAKGLSSETLGVLRTAESDVPNLTDDPVVRLMQGASEEMIGQLDAATSDLGDHSVDGRADTALWRAALSAEKGDWPEATALATQGIAVLKTYPPALRRKLSMLLSEALFRGKDYANAEQLAKDILASGPTQGQSDYATVLLGRLAAVKGDVTKAMKLWKTASQSPSIDLGRAQGTYALAVTQLSRKEISRPDAIAAIDRLRYAWRGDEFEITVLTKLAELYAEDSNYPAAFETLQRIITGYPDSAVARDATARMQDIFGSIFTGTGAETLAPLTALALYDQYKELTPAGPAGDAIVRKLADRLVSVDLLDRAGALLEEQVKTRLTGLEQARVATRVALVRLMNNQPTEAIAALDIPTTVDLPADLARQRAELRARALTELGKPADALQLLNGDDSSDADRLRGDIAVKTENWPALVGLLQKTLKEPGPDGKLDREAASTVLRLATAMALGRDKPGLAALTLKYAAAMDASPFKDSFRVLSGSTPTTAGTLADRVAQISDLQSFMSEYRQRVQQDKLSAIN
jgi:tetratricopeptide (TPR) repeat protein